MKNLKIFTGLLVLVIMVSGCITTDSQVPAHENRMLIVYYSLSGNTKFAAEYIQTLTGADIFELELVEPYSEEYQETLERARQEREASIRPQLAATVDNLADYNVIFIGSPNWFGTLALPVLSFLETHDLSGKTIVPFVTFGGGGLQNTITDLRTLVPDAVMLEEFGVAGSTVENSQSAITEWLTRIGMIE